MKKYILLLISCILISYVYFAKIYSTKVIEPGTNEIKTNELTQNKNVEPPIIIDEDIIEPTKVKEQVKVDIKIKEKKDLEAITAEAYMVGDLISGKIYLESNSEKVFPIASLSKFFTAIVATNIMDLKSKVTITQPMLEAYGEAGNLVKGEVYTVEELLYPMLLESSNDAAEAIAQSYGYDKFIGFMNSIALEIGMKHTSFKDASGLNSGNVSNIRDLFILSKYYFDNEKKILEITKQKDFAIATTTDHGFHKYISINPFVVYEPFIGGKTGRTKEAKESMISLFNVEMGTSTRPVAVILLRSSIGEREMDTEKVLIKVMN